MVVLVILFPVLIIWSISLIAFQPKGVFRVVVDFEERTPNSFVVHAKYPACEPPIFRYVFRLGHVLQRVGLPIHLGANCVGMHHIA